LFTYRDKKVVGVFVRFRALQALGRDKPSYFTLNNLVITLLVKLGFRTLAKRAAGSHSRRQHCKPEPGERAGELEIEVVMFVRAAHQAGSQRGHQSALRSTTISRQRSLASYATPCPSDLGGKQENNVRCLDRWVD
jgi:hypothetical protein